MRIPNCGPSRAAVGLLFFGWFTAHGVAQTGPNFSGDWRMAPAAAATLLPPRMVVEQTVKTTTARGTPMPPFYDRITVRREYPSGATTASYGLGIVGGTVSSAVPGSTFVYKTHYEATWSGETLVISSGDHTGSQRETGVWHEREEQWRLESPGILEVELTVRSSEEGSRIETARYIRQPQ